MNKSHLYPKFSFKVLRLTKIRMAVTSYLYLINYAISNVLELTFLLSVHLIVGIVLSVLHTLSQLIPTTPRSSKKETVERIRTQRQVCLTPKLC